MQEFDPNQKSAIINAAVKAQHQAADPHQSVWVSANAGTGKTRVLTNRILRLLINGAAVSDILAVTYTRAAAAEMRNRLFDTLSRWAVIAETALTDEIMAMGIDRPSQEQLARSRRLFAHMLDHPSGVRIETVHAFAQSILRRFPLEAGVQPYFDLATNEQITAMKSEAQAQIIVSPHPAFKKALLNLGQQISERKLPELTSGLFARPDLLQEVETNPVKFKQKLFAALGCSDAIENQEEAKTNKIAAAIQNTSMDLLREMIRLCQDGNKTEKQICKDLALWCALDDADKIDQYTLYRAALLTKDGSVRKTFPSAQIKKEYPSQVQALLMETMRIQDVLRYCHAVDTAALTFDLYVVAAAMAGGYQQSKTDAGLMDYDDLIWQTINLLNQDGGASWVRYKLDRGLKYLLVDEAQDTSPSQWKILSAIAGEFFVDTGEDEGKTPDRSLFSVGDFKQSIYSFQGARPELFKKQQSYFNALAIRAEKPFMPVPLNTSFRTTAPILKLVDEVSKINGGLAGLGQASDHPVARVGEAGFVEMLDPVRIDNDGTAMLDAFVPYDGSGFAGAEQTLAKKIVDILKAWIGKRYLPAKGRVMQASDVMILVRKRDHFAATLDRELRLSGLPVAGADRVKLMENIAVMDLVALGQVMVLPEDDLTLAVVLKSPLFGLSEDHLFALAHDRGEASLIQQLALFAAEHEDNLYRDAHSLFLTWLGLAEQLTPYEFYRDVLSADIIKNFIKRLGRPITDVLAEFLEIARDFETIHPPSLQHFLAMIRESDLEVSRDGNAKASDEIRIMTIHGSKGLESPIVVLPDMLKSKNMPDPLIEISNDNGSLLVKSAHTENTLAADVIVRAKDAAKIKSQEEENRLLYVALTRAEEGLLIAGYEASRIREIEGSWYQICRDALENIDGVQPRKDETGLALVTAQTAPVKEQILDQEKQAPDPHPLPSWLDQAAPEEALPPRPLSPSRFSHDDQAASPSGVNRQMAMLRGSITHRLLEILPGLDADAQDRAASRIVAPYYPDPLDDQAIASIRSDVDQLLRNPSLKNIFDQNGRVEVPISGRLGNQMISGVIDRLMITDHDVMIIDFKTGQPPVHGNIPQDYISQLAIYRHVLAELYPAHHIRAGLVYTEDASLHWVDEKAMDMVIQSVLTTIS